MHLSRIACALLLTISICPSAHPVEPEAIRYTLRFPAPQTHYVEVSARIPTGGAAAVELMMPVWTPGSYLVREYERNVEGLIARTPSGKPLSAMKTRKNRWSVQTDGEPAVDLSYRVYCRTMSVQGAFVDKEFAILNGAAVFITLADRAERPHEVQVELPAEWKTSITALPSAGAPHAYRAPDYDTLVDSPLLAGNPQLYEFDVDGRRHFLVNEGEGGVWDGPRSAKDVEKIVREYRRMWGFLPYRNYVFLNLITESGGGLEHKNSTLMMTSRWATRTPRGYLRWLGLVGHEYFHAWNVKRLRPVELGPFDYENENYTKSLWIAEGFTSYYGALAVHRAGLSKREEFLEALSSSIQALQSAPGRLSQPLEDASYDAWIRLYRPDENTVNTTISYYTKGSVIAFLLDAKVRSATNGAKSLDDVMKLAYERYSGPRGYTPEEFRQTAEDVAGISLREWFRRVLDTAGELDYTEALGWYGLRFKPEEPPKPGAAPAPDKAWTGLVTTATNGRLAVSGVKRDTPGYDAGFNVGDEILAIDDYRVRPDQWAARMEYYRPGDKVSVLIARRDKLMRLDTVFAKLPAPTWKLEADPKATEAQKEHLKAWVEVQ